MNPLLKDRDAFIELPVGMDFREPGQVDPFDVGTRFYSGDQWTELELKKIREQGPGPIIAKVSELASRYKGDEWIKNRK